MSMPHLRPAVLAATLATTLLLAPLSALGKNLSDDSVLDRTPDRSERLDGYDTPGIVTSRMASAPLHTVEGLWRFATEGSLMAIERTDSRPLDPDEAGVDTYRMVIVRAADISLRPGTIIGYLTPTARRGVYDARIYTSRSDDGTRLHSPKKFTLTLGDDNSRLAIATYGNSLRFNWWRLLPYMYRRVVTPREKSPGDINGCLRVYPAPATPIEPRYL